MKIGYDINLSIEISEKLSAFGTTVNLSRPKNKQTDIQCFEEFLLSHKEDEIVLDTIEGIGRFTFVQLAKSLAIIEQYQINLHFLNPAINGVSINQDFIEILTAIVKHEEKAIKKRTNAGLALAKSQGRIGGRPRISEDIVKQIHYLSTSMGKTNPEIATELNISLGTVYKYLAK